MTNENLVLKRRTVLWLLLGYSAAHFLYSAVLTARRIDGGDMLSAFPGPLSFRLGRVWPPLARDWVNASFGDGTFALWNYGPALHALTIPFGLASTLRQAMQWMLIVDVALVAATMALWLNMLLPGRCLTAPALAILCVWLNHFPLLEAVAGREVEIFELFLITVGIQALKRDREGLAGFVFGLAATTKFLPGVFVPYLFIKGYNKAARIALAIVVSIGVLAQPLLGWQASITVAAGNAQQNDAEFPTAYANQSIENVLQKTFAAFDIDNPHPPTAYPHSLRGLGNAVSLAVLAATGWFLVRCRRRRLVETECALLAIVMCLVPIHANTYYFVFLLPALSIGVAALTRAGGLGTAPKIALAGAVSLSGFLVPMKFFEIATGVPGVLIARALQQWSLPAYGAVLGAALMLELHRLQRGLVTSPLASAKVR